MQRFILRIFYVPSLIFVAACSSPPEVDQNSDLGPLLPHKTNNGNSQDKEKNETSREFQHLYLADWHSLSVPGAEPSGIVHANLTKADQIPEFKLAAEVPYPVRFTIDSERKLLFVASHQTAAGPSTTAHLYAYEINPVTGALKNLASQMTGSVLQISGSEDRQLFMTDVALHPSLPIMCVSYESFFPDGNRYGADRIRCYEYTLNPFRLKHISANLESEIYRPLSLRFVNDGSHVVVAGWGNRTNLPTLTSYRFDKQTKTFSRETQLTYPGLSLHTIVPHPKNPQLFFTTAKFDDGSDTGVTQVLSFTVSNTKALSEVDRLADSLGFFVRNLLFNKEADILFAPNSSTDGENDYSISSVEVNAKGVFGNILDTRKVGNIAVWDLVPMGKERNHILATQLTTGSLKGSLILYSLEEDYRLRFVDEKAVSFSPRDGRFVSFKVEGQE